MLASPLNTNGSHLPCFDVYISKKKKKRWGEGAKLIYSLLFKPLKTRCFSELQFSDFRKTKQCACVCVICELTWLSNGKHVSPCNYKYKISPSTNDLSDLNHTKYSKIHRFKHSARSTLLLTSFPQSCTYSTHISLRSWLSVFPR